MKQCTKCGETKPRNEFYKNKYAKEGLTSQCKKCKNVGNQKYLEANRERARVRAEKWRRANPDRVKAANKKWRESNLNRTRVLNRKNNLKRKYGLTLPEWRSLFDAQGNTCAICGASEPGGQGWQTDHSHDSGKIRGILCVNCNTMLGRMRDSEEIASKAIDYLSNSRCQVACGQTVSQSLSSVSQGDMAPEKLHSHFRSSQKGLCAVI